MAEAKEIISRKEAIEKGLKKYFTGIQCRNGHISERQTLNSVCVECHNEWVRNVYNKRPEVIKKMQENSRKHYAKNKEKVLEKSKERVASGYLREYYQKNKEVMILKAREWSKNNYEKKKIYTQNRRAKGSVRLSPNAVEEIIKLQRGKCAICLASLSKAGKHIDHIIPISKGGTSHPHNIQMLCPTCNRKKSNIDPIEFMQRNGKLL